MCFFKEVIISGATGFALGYVGGKIASRSVNKKATAKAKLEKVKNFFNDEEGAVDFSKSFKNSNKGKPEPIPIEDTVNKGDTVETPINSGSYRPREKDTPNSIYEQINVNGKVKSRAFYDENGRQFSRQDFDHSHFDKTTKQYYQPHEHNYSYNKYGQRNGRFDGALPDGYTNRPTK